MAEKDTNFDFLKGLGDHESNVPGNLWDNIHKGVVQSNQEHKDLIELQGLKHHRSGVPGEMWDRILAGLTRRTRIKWAFISAGLACLIAVIGWGALTLSQNSNNNNNVELKETGKANASAGLTNEIPESKANATVAKSRTELEKDPLFSRKTVANPTPINPLVANNTNNSEQEQTTTGTTSVNNVEETVSESGMVFNLFLNRPFSSFPKPELGAIHTTNNYPIVKILEPVKKTNPPASNLYAYAGGDAALNIPHFGFSKYSKFYWPDLHSALKNLAVKTGSYNPSIGLQYQKGKNLFSGGLMLSQIQLKIIGNFSTDKLPNINSKGEVESLQKLPFEVSYGINATIKIESFALPLNYYRQFLNKQKSKLFVGGGITPNFTFMASGSFINGANVSSYVNGETVFRKLNSDINLGLIYQKSLSKKLSLQGQLGVSKNMINMFAADYKQASSVGFVKPSAGFRVVYRLQ